MAGRAAQLSPTKLRSVPSPQAPATTRTPPSSVTIKKCHCWYEPVSSISSFWPIQNDCEQLSLTTLSLCTKRYQDMSKVSASLIRERSFRYRLRESSLSLFYLGFLQGLPAPSPKLPVIIVFSSSLTLTLDSMELSSKE